MKWWKATENIDTSRNMWNNEKYFRLRNLYYSIEIIQKFVLFYIIF